MLSLECWACTLPSCCPACDCGRSSPVGGVTSPPLALLAGAPWRLLLRPSISVWFISFSLMKDEKFVIFARFPPPVAGDPGRARSLDSSIEGIYKFIMCWSLPSSFLVSSLAFAPPLLCPSEAPSEAAWPPCPRGLLLLEVEAWRAAPGRTVNGFEVASCLLRVPWNWPAWPSACACGCTPDLSFCCGSWLGPPRAARPLLLFLRLL